MEKPAEPAMVPPMEHAESPLKQTEPPFETPIKQAAPPIEASEKPEKPCIGKTCLAWDVAPSPSGTSKHINRKIIKLENIHK